MNFKKLLTISVSMFLILVYAGCKGQSVEQLLLQGKVKAAEKRCQKMKAPEKIECCKTIAAFYFQGEKYREAAYYYALASDPVKAINCYFLGDFFPEAEKYCAALVGPAKIQCAESLGEKFFLRGDYTKAILYYTTAGNSGEVAKIQAKIPLFQLAERIGKKSDESSDPAISGTLKNFQETLSRLIYMDRYFQWPYARDAEPYKTAAAVREKALNLLQNQAAPYFVNTLSSSAFDWSSQRIRSISFDHFKLDSLVNLITHLHRLAEKKDFFTKYSSSSPGKSPGEEKTLPLSFLYEQVYMKALEHSQALLTEIEESDKVKEKGGLPDYKNDITIDNQVIEYISSMLNNIRIRVEDLRRRSQDLENNTRDSRLKETARRVFEDFTGQCGQVLQLISREEYQKANDLLISGYDTAKAGLESRRNTNR